ncbi:MAG: hypothetical protein GY884_19890 [Proteobacteria bacterium]|nr:hypothetical protein [Pseudomonadota bacterium]
MLTGGRVLHHLARLAPNPDNTILIVGYQAPGTRGVRLLAGEETVRLHGREIDVRCHVEQVDGFSAHADANGLLDWIRAMSPAPRRVWLNHGEPASADALRLRVRDELDWEARVAVEGTAWELRDLAASGVPPRVENGR